ncbi:dihydroxyacetone kinase subunit DhaL [Amaricoccus sp.]|uniref:dihydroxyacetone kinase subunit DhaL n=1 Tax=Amaricoccus sp. TaxID=1872485 RepID=UPI001B57009B|nr:dihydroxyacetone kinase subunit DhaL [Amaricoccus sp.]MBP7002632.1 dihydroxyacetone kinase subunit L [Amaricoccus sp.]
MAVTGDDLRAMLAEIATAIAAEKDELCRLDGVIGDADHGVAMALGFGAARDAAAALDPGADPTAVLNAAARAFLSAVGASTGPLYATALMRAGAAVKGKAALDDADVVALVQAMAKGIADRGKAEPGEKTMLDAWAPAAEAIAATPGPLAARLAAAEAAAQAGAEATKAMVAGKGRSSRLGERALGHIDPGAASAVIVIAAMSRALGRVRSSSGPRPAV